MTVNQQWSILWPKTITKELAQKRVLKQIQQSSSQILISNHQPKEFYSNLIIEKPELCQMTYLELQLEKDIADKNYRFALQDKLCFLSEEYSCAQSNQMHLEICSIITPKYKKDFSRFLMDVLVFFRERFFNIFKTNSIFIDAPTFDLKDTLDLLKTGDKHPFFGLSYFPYNCEKQGFDTLKTSFLWKPRVHSILLSDIGFDFKTEAVPGDGITPNKSACQIALEDEKKISFIFKPKYLPLEKESQIEEFLWKSENFISNLSQ